MVKLCVAAMIVVLVVCLTSEVECQGDRTPVCNFVTNAFRRRNCFPRKRFPCGVYDWKLRTLSCREFPCENYRDIDTFCTSSCSDLEIANGICPSGSVCCLSIDSNVKPEQLTPLQGSEAFDFNFKA